MEEREVVYKATCAAMERRRVRIERSCLFWALEATKAIKVYTGRRAVIQAGTAFWPICPLDKDDGSRPLNYGYQWEPPESVPTAMMQTILTGYLPEIHCWAAIPDTLEIIDFTTSFQPQICKEQIGADWVDQPPLFLWQPANKLPERYYYEPVPEAINFCLALLRVHGYGL